VSRFFIIALSVFASVHFYIWSRLVYAPELGPAWTTALTTLMLILYASIPLTFAFGRRASSRAALAFVWPGYVWLGTLFLLFVSVVALAVVAWPAGASLAVALPAMAFLEVALPAVAVFAVALPAVALFAVPPPAVALFAVPPPAVAVFAVPPATLRSLANATVAPLAESPPAG